MPGGVLDGLRISFRFEMGPAACPAARSYRIGPVRCLPNVSLDNCLTGKIR